MCNICNETPWKATIYRWFNYFQNGRTSVLIGKSPWRPIDIDEKLTESLKKFVKNEREITIRELTARINVSKGTLHTLLTNLSIRKLCSRYVSRFLAAGMQHRRMQCCREILSSVGDSFLDNIKTMDVTPLSLYVPESRRESNEWKLQGETCSRKYPRQHVIENH